MKNVIESVFILLLLVAVFSCGLGIMSARKKEALCRETVKEGKKYKNILALNRKYHFHTDLPEMLHIQEQNVKMQILT